MSGKRTRTEKIAFRSGPENVMEIAISAQRILKVPTYFPVLKVSKFQKQILLFSFQPKNERNYFLIFALVSENGLNQKNEGSL